MSLQLRKRPSGLPLEVTCDHGSGGAEDETDRRNVLVNYGIHRGRFPVGGMRIRQARQVLQRLLNIDPSAVAVINGTPITDEDQIIGADVAMLHFVKPSSIKGAAADRRRDPRADEARSPGSGPTAWDP
jgi:hypothetical protein